MLRQKERERRGGSEGRLGDSLGLLQRRRRWTACDDWRLSVEKKKRRGGRDEHTWVT